MDIAEPVNRLIEELKRLPGIGSKSAQRLAFFILWVMALTGTVLPIAYLLNRRFATEPPAEPNVIVREALWVGIYGATLAWLQLGRLVSLWVWMGLGGGLIAAEYLIRLREKARWKPPANNDDPA